MTENIAHSTDPAAMAAELRQDLAQGDAMIGTIAPILRHLIAKDEHSVFGDDIIAAMRGMMADLARQLLEAAAGAEEVAADSAERAAEITGLANQLAGDPALLAHFHALALEGQLTQRLQARLALDPVLSPLLQALISSEESPVAASAMALLAAQARFIQQQRRMQLDLNDLPGDLLHGALSALRAVSDTDLDRQAQVDAAESKIRAGFDEGRSRIGLISRLVTGMGGGATVALSISHAGVAIFLSALSIASGQDRDLAVLSTNESQVARLALALRAAGLRPGAIEEQFESLHPNVTLPPFFETLGSDQAAALLSRSTAYPGG